MTFTNTEIAQIQRYSISQQSEEFGVTGPSKITVWPVNPLPEYAMLVLKWTKQMDIVEGTVCEVETYKKFENDVCYFDYEQRTVTIGSVFLEKGYDGRISVAFDKLKNPLTNQQLQDIEITTYYDWGTYYPVDRLNYPPKLRCEYPCRDCSAKGDSCTKCWSNDPNPFLMISESKQTCESSCDKGWTSNGREDKVCERCESSCETCVDQG